MDPETSSEPHCAPAALRVDAARNRAALVAAARSVFGELGLDAPLDLIARRAGVGNATLYRRFPARQELVTAVFIDQMQDYADAADRALAEPDAWTGFRSYVLQVLAMQAADRGLADLLSSNFDDNPCAAAGDLESLRASAYDSLEKLVARAQEAGALRADFVPQDLALLLMANAGLVHRTCSAAPSSWARLAAFVLDGLQASAATPAPAPPSEPAVIAAMRRTALARRSGPSGC
jgi:AcrR family transcriptional regulator